MAKRWCLLAIENYMFRPIAAIIRFWQLSCYIYLFFYPLWRCGPTRVMTSSFLRFLNHTQRRITVGRTPLDEWSARRRDLYLTTHNTHNRQTSTPPVGFEPTVSAGERPQTYALVRAATGTGNLLAIRVIYNMHKPRVDISPVARKLSKPDDGRYRPKHVVFYC